MKMSQKMMQNLVEIRKNGWKEEKMEEVNENIIILNKGVGLDINKDFDSLNENKEVKINKNIKYQEFLKHKHKKDKKKEKTYDEFFRMKHGKKKLFIAI